MTFLSQMELSEKEKSAFLREFGHRVEALIYQKYPSKDQFIAEHGFNKRSLHDVLTGTREAHLTIIARLAKALGLKPKDLF